MATFSFTWVIIILKSLYFTSVQIFFTDTEKCCPVYDKLTEKTDKNWSKTEIK